MTKAVRLKAVLGARAAITYVEDFHPIVERGLPFTALESVMQQLELRQHDVERTLSLPLSTFHRRKRERTLRKDESDRLFRLARIAVDAYEVFGSWPKVAAWLHRPNRALGGDPPLWRLDTEPGSLQVEALLGRIEAGVVS
jgi:putative toxin-antitoxin system antitoxin component (TIGR02293 family)